MPGPYKGFLTERTTQQQHTKPRHQPSDRDQRARGRLRNKASAFQAKIKSPAYIALGAAALQTIYQTFDLLDFFLSADFPVSLHLPNLTTETAANTIPTLYVIQKDRHCMPTSDYYFPNIQPDPIIIPPHRGNNSSSTPQQAAAKDPIPQQTDILVIWVIKSFFNVLPTFTLWQENVYNCVHKLRHKMHFTKCI